MKRIAIVGGGPKTDIPHLTLYKDDIDLWIGADRGAEVLVEHGIPIDVAVGDFDSITADSLQAVKQNAVTVEQYPAEKNETDLELAVKSAWDVAGEKQIVLFGVTGGRFDHSLSNVQLLYELVERGCRSVIVDVQNEIELFHPGTYSLEHKARFPYVSFVPISFNVHGLTLTGFRYPLTGHSVAFGSTLCISNKLISETGTFSFEEGILLLIRSRDMG
ncbi:thiamine diphosphokinase [Thalassobacillus sp. CUG 92003]|uniref:thiamine diphosphokinase n=1 Tax=Thalassobacillus sp. CUG 92003 TaxID=2736641 RepID=UPI0015E790B9